MAWWRFWVTKKKISVQVEDEAYERYNAEAKRRGISLSDLTREGLEKVAPYRVDDGSAAAFSALDALDARALPSRSPGPLRPVVAPRRIDPLPGPDGPTRAPTGTDGPTPGHPCAHFTASTMPGRLPATCARQNGRPCPFPARIAAQCDLYQVRRR
jgi:hypothetical protein